MAPTGMWHVLPSGSALPLRPASARDVLSAALMVAPLGGSARDHLWHGEARANVLGPVAALPSVLLGPLSSPVTSGFLQHRACHQEVRECRLPDGHRADSCAGQRADASVACDPIEELESLSSCGLKVSWPRQKASASAKAASSCCVGTRAASSGDPGAAQVLSRGGSGCAPAASSDGSCDGPPSCSCLPSCAADESLAAALEDLKALEACGFPVTWPR